MKTLLAFGILFNLITGTIGQTAPGFPSVPGVIPGGIPVPAAPKPPIKLIHKPKAMVAYRLEFQVADQIFFVNSIGGNFALNTSHITPNGERAFTIQGEFLPGAGVAAGMFEFKGTLLESNLDNGAEGNYTCQGSTLFKKGQAQQLATLGHHVLSLTVKEVREKK
ncbi:MAG: hypothetical protein H8E27_02380 [Verrucomicrobia subdivision 3 bacterium]|nr:hypothetical protein [Limisphaerales bacterium]